MTIAGPSNDLDTSAMYNANHRLEITLKGLIFGKFLAKDSGCSNRILVIFGTFY